MTFDPVNDQSERYVTLCPDCDAQFNEGEEGYNQEECFECGEPNCYEIPG